MPGISDATSHKHHRSVADGGKTSQRLGSQTQAGLRHRYRHAEGRPFLQHQHSDMPQHSQKNRRRHKYTPTPNNRQHRQKELSHLSLRERAAQWATLPRNLSLPGRTICTRASETEQDHEGLHFTPTDSRDIQLIFYNRLLPYRHSPPNSQTPAMDTTSFTTAQAALQPLRKEKKVLIIYAAWEEALRAL